MTWEVIHFVTIEASFVDLNKLLSIVRETGKGAFKELCLLDYGEIDSGEIHFRIHGNNKTDFEGKLDALKDVIKKVCNSFTISSNEYADTNNGYLFNSEA